MADDVEIPAGKKGTFGECGLHVMDGVPQDGLVSRNITVKGKRTSIRLEPAMWDALEDISASEKCTLEEICDTVDKLRAADGNFTSAMRVFIMEYYRKAEADKVV